MGEEPTAAEQAAAMAQALRSQRGAGGLALLTGDRVLGNFGQALLNQAQQGEGMLAQAGQQRSGNVLRQALARQEASQEATQNAARVALEERRRREDQMRQDERDALNRRNAKEVAGISAGNKSAQEAFERETSLRKEFQAIPAVKEFTDTETNFNSLREALKDKTGIGATTSVFSFMKMLDPGVAVMQGDVDLIRQSGGKAAAYANLYESVLNGNPLSDAVRADMLRQATNLYNNRKKGVDEWAKKYSVVASEIGASPDRVLLRGKPDVDLTAPAAPKPATPAARPTPPAGMVTVRFPGGQEAFIPAGKLAEAIRDHQAVEVK